MNNQEEKKWGIDLAGRRMWYEPWPVDQQGRYRPPDKIEIDNIYGISGEAVRETLLYFEECGGDTGKLIQLLNEHAPNLHFMIDRATLLDKTRWYNNEYYFYFIMFTKKVMGNYDWHFNKAKNVQLSAYHKIYEKGFLNYKPYGEKESGTINAIPLSGIEYYTLNGTDFTDFYDWVEALTSHETTISYKDEVCKLENYKMIDQFHIHLINLIQILVNENNVLQFARKCFEHYNLKGFAYVPESKLVKALTYFTKKSTTYFDIDIKYNKNNSLNIVLKESENHDIAKDFIYQASNYQIANSLAIGGFQQVIKKMFHLDGLPEIKNLSGLKTNFCTFTITWKTRPLSIPYFQLFICDLSAIILFGVDHYLNGNIAYALILFFVPLNILLITLRRLKIEKNKRKIVEEHSAKMGEENIKRLERAEKLSIELMKEKETLEQKVKERTAKLAEANEKLKELDIAKTSFFANVSHELRTPLTLILGPLESILNRRPGASIECGDDQFKMMRSNGLKLLKLVNNLLDFTKIESCKMIVQRKKTDIAELLKLYTSIVKTYAETRRISVVFNDNTKNVSGNLIAWVDRDLLEKAVFNLLSNALKFTPNGGSVIIQLDCEDDFFSIAVKDSGIGIPEDKLDVIFERFTQVDGSSSRQYEGTGIGLSLTKEIAEIMGGKISVASRLGEGSTFTIRMPFSLEGDTNSNDEIEQIKEVKSYLLSEFRVERKPDGPKAALNHKTEKSHAKKILIVEDSKEMQDYLISLLEKDYEIYTADNGLQGLEKAEKIKPDLILTDVMMPEMDGYEMTRRLKLKEDLCGIPLLMLTAKADMDMKLEGFEKGAVDYMIKPFHANELKVRIKAHLEMKALRDRILMQKNELSEQNRVLQETMEQKDRAQKQLHESEQRFREMAEYSPMALVEMNEKMQITYLNRSGFELFDVTAEDIKRGVVFSSFLDAGEQERFHSIFKHFSLPGCAESAKLHEFKFRTQDGRETIGLFKAIALYQENQIVGLRAIITEIRTYMDLALLPEDDFYAQYNISPREKDVFLHILKGYKNREIGEKLFISERTVKKHTSSILEKTNAHNKRDLFRLVKEHQNPQTSI